MAGLRNEDLHEIRSYLLRYARLRLRDPALAEDVVQETMLAALDTTAHFAGKSQYKSWLVGILKHKIVDAVRKAAREQPAAGGDESSEFEWIEDLFNENGGWRELPANWGNPEQSLQNSQFWKVLELCLEVMPPRTARVFMMREVMELASEQICKDLAITETNLWVMLHRARLSLRGCLEAKWFHDTTK